MIRRTLAPVICSLLLASPAAAVPVDRGKAVLGATSLPIRGGNLENGEGTLRLRGKLKFAGAVLRGLQIDLRPGGLVTARFEGLRQKVFAVNLSKARVGARVVPIRIRGVRLRTAGALADVRRKPRLSVTARPRYLAVAGGQTTLALDESFAAALSAESVTPGANEGAVIDDRGRAQFPISRGRIVLSRRGRGSVDHGGGLSFSKANVVELRLNDFKLKQGSAPLLLARANESDNRVPIASVALEALAFDRGQALIGDSAAVLTGEGATVLNDEFGTSRFAAGDPFGLLTVDAVIQ